MSRITESSLMEESIPVRYCFVMLLAIADPKGYAIGTDVALARRMNMPLAEFKACIAELMKPDANSNSKEQEGRRVVESDCERGYFLVNYQKYRDTRDEEERREYMRTYMRKYRGGDDVAPVNSGKPSKQPLAKVEGEVQEKAEEEKKAPESKQPASVQFPLELQSAGFAKAWGDWYTYRRQAKLKTYTQIGAEKQLKELAEIGTSRAIAAINHSIANGYQGIFEPKSNGVKPASVVQPRKPNYETPTDKKIREMQERGEL